LKPKVLLLDEPLSALDKKMREQMQSELRRLQRQVGITFILVTHDQEEALIMSDRIAVMFDGEIAQMASPQELYRRPSSRRVGEFIGVMNFLEAKQTGTSEKFISFDVEGLGRADIALDQIPEGARATADVVGLRPEALSILFDGQKAEGRVVDATVQDLAYYGDMTYYDVTLDGSSTPVTISMKNLISRPVLERGTKTRVQWDERSLVIFAA
jgi:spermidine/putrescine transport system ATP-binding protein